MVRALGQRSTHTLSENADGVATLLSAYAILSYKSCRTEIGNKLS